MGIKMPWRGHKSQENVKWFRFETEIFQENGTEILQENERNCKIR